MISFARLLLALAAAILVAAIVVAIPQAPLFESFAGVAADPWGFVGLVDLYVGFLIFAIVLFLVERPSHAFLWFLALMLLGNIVSAAWLIWRLPLLHRRLARPPAD